MPSSTTTTKAQRQEDVYPHVVMDVLPFQRAWGKSKNCQSPWLSERVWNGFLSNVRGGAVMRSTYGSMCPSPPIRPLPLFPFLRKVSSLRPLPNGKFFPRRKVRQFFFSVRVVTACRSWQPDLACLSPISRSTDHIVDSCTHDLLASFLGSHKYYNDNDNFFRHVQSQTENKIQRGRKDSYEDKRHTSRLQDNRDRTYGGSA